MALGHRIQIEELTAEAFAPFGRVLEPSETADFDLPTKSLHRFPWQCDAPVIVQLLSFKPQPFKVHKIERHFHVTESRMHIGGSATVIVVSEPAEEVPSPVKLRAFRLDRQGVMFKQGTWHAVDAYPLGAEPGLFLFLSDKETQSELFDNPVADPRRSVIRTYDENPPEIWVD
ncbi:ureidoglycolate lyase [Rhizobium sp. CNPSo 3968]|uniref:ureidoglycolate lyase n=1 Tax=Rhizobium sp. CNPSo 3968 TaxID=3021408 RepID=UPI00254B5CC4|nr:ureidoglycolate lyase [Rhizobium sp. CNPSo 3968]MDK4717903.1 ureidoglycolate lyase [Rhizobium sp. CNPSo 3968]